MQFATKIYGEHISQIKSLNFGLTTKIHPVIIMLDCIRKIISVLTISSHVVGYTTCPS